ncbi:uncharacterized protein [Dermacentor albipictus]|uniref:uncharacterized protein n=1 Tax=Dermacentor albipictus TaxID=60249 RepID=UPI0038FC9DB5
MSTMTSTCVLAGLLCVATLTWGAAPPATDCINVEIGDILGIRECIGPSSNFCGGTSANGLGQAAMKIIECAVLGSLKNGPHDVITSALPSIMPLFRGSGALDSSAASTLPQMGDLGNMNICGPNGCEVENNFCNGSITIGLPSSGNLEKCFGNMTMGCEPGSPTTINVVQSLFKAVICIIYELPGSPIAALHKIVGCALVNALKVAEMTNPDLRMVHFAFESAVSATLDLQNCPTFG